MDDSDMFARLRAAAQRKAAERSQRADYFPVQLNTQGMMVSSGHPSAELFTSRNTLSSPSCEDMYAGRLVGHPPTHMRFYTLIHTPHSP